MRALRILTVLAVLAALGWGLYWVAGSRALNAGITRALPQATAQGLTMAGHSISGFPNRFDITLDAPRLSRPGFDWSAPFVQVFALSYRLNHLIAVFAHDQRLDLGGREFLLHSDDLRASVVMQAGLDLPLDEVLLVGRGLDLRLEGQSLAAEGLRLGLRRIGPQRFHGALVTEGLRPDPALMASLDPEGLWPRALAGLRLDIEIETDTELDRHLLTGAPPRVQTLALTGFAADWEESAVTLAGRLTPDSLGALSGDVVMTVTGWRALSARARAAGLLTEGPVALVVAALPVSEDGDRLDVPMAVQSGDVRIGPILLGTLPPLR